MTTSVPAKWHIRDGDPFERGSYVLCDGKRFDWVRAYDVNTGWLEVLCRGDLVGHPRESHMRPDGTGICVARYRGRLEVRGRVREQ
jgi:hypothetical protein